MIPEELLYEMHRWIRDYPLSSGSIEEENQRYFKAKDKKLRQLSKKYNVPLSTLEEYYI